MLCRCERKFSAYFAYFAYSSFLTIMILMTMMWIDQMGCYANVKGKSSTMTLQRSLANLGIDSLDRKVLLRVCDNGADN